MCDPWFCKLWYKLVPFCKNFKLYSSHVFLWIHVWIPYYIPVNTVWIPNCIPVNASINSILYSWVWYSCDYNFQFSTAFLWIQYKFHTWRAKNLFCRKTAMRIESSSTLHGQHAQFRVINKAMKIPATNMISGIFLEYTKGHTQ